MENERVRSSAVQRDESLDGGLGEPVRDRLAGLVERLAAVGALYEVKYR